MGGRYPSLSPIVFPRQSRTARILQPGVVLVTIVVLLLCCVIGMSIGVTIFKETRPEPLSTGVSACQALVVISSGFSMLYIFLHGLASYYNEPIGLSRPPEKRIHAFCFIVARLTMILWIIAIIAAAAVVGRPNICVEGSKQCTLHILDLIASNLAFVATGILLTALEACQYPFELPEQLTTGITCRVSSFGDDYFDRSISSGSSLKSNEFIDQEKSKPIVQQPSTRRRNSPTRPSMPGEYPDERRMTPLLPMIPVSKPQGWGEEWKHLVDDVGRDKHIQKADSAISLGSDTSVNSSRSGSTDSSPYYVLDRQKRPRVVTPSSHISNQSRRSPLCRMRSAEFPDVVIQSQMRFMPPSIPPQHEWSSARQSPITKVPPIADPARRRRPPVVTPKPMLKRRSVLNHRPISRKPVPITRRRTIDVKVPGAYIDYRLSLDDERKLEEHARKIDAEFAAIAQIEERSIRPKKSLTGYHEQLYPSNPLGSKDQYRKQRPVTEGERAVRNQPPDLIHSMRGANNENMKAQPLRPLSLGDTS